MLITSQHYLNEETVASKIAARDFQVFVSPVVEFGGETFRVVMDGHHSLAAAIEAGVDPELIEQTESDNDKIGLIASPDVFLESCWMDGEYINAVTRACVW